MKWVCKKCDHTVYLNNAPRLCSQCGAPGVLIRASADNGNGNEITMI